VHADCLFFPKYKQIPAMFCPSRPATAPSLPLPEMIRDMYYVVATSSASAFESLLRLLDSSSYIVYLPPFFPKHASLRVMETAPLFQNPMASTACVPAFSASHTNNTKISSKALHFTKKSRQFRHMCERRRPLYYKTSHRHAFFLLHYPPPSSSFSKRT